MPTIAPALRFLVFIKGELPGSLDRYVFLWDDAYRADLMNTLGRYASDRDLSFTWYDAAVVAKAVRM